MSLKAMLVMHPKEQKRLRLYCESTCKTKSQHGICKLAYPSCSKESKISHSMTE